MNDVKHRHAGVDWPDGECPICNCEAAWEASARAHRKQIADLEGERDKTCKWTEEREGTYWNSGCGELHLFTDGGPDENKQKFCPYCGGHMLRGDVLMGESTSELHIPPEVADAMRALRPELRAKLSLRDIDDMTRPFRKRIAELELRVKEVECEKRETALAAGDNLLEMKQRIAELEDERQQWLEWNERKGPGLEAYREQGQRIAELEDERDIFKRTLDKRDKRIAELEPDATAYRKLCDIRKRHPGIPCACEFSDDNSDTVLSWCEFHKQYRDFMREYDRAAKQHAMPSYLDDARKAEGE